MARTKLEVPIFRLNRAKDGYYHIRYEENGQTKRKSTGTKDPKEAERVRAQFAADYVKPKLRPSPTIGEVCSAYIKHRTPLVAAPETLPYVFAAPIRLLGDLKAESFTQTQVADYVTRRGKEKAQSRFAGRYNGATVSEATISKELRMLRAAMNWAFSEDMLERKPEFRIELSAGKVRDDWITKEEANALMREASPHLALFILIALSTAKRREAILDLRWDNIDLSRPGHESIDFGDDVGNKKRGVTPIAGNTRLIAALKDAKERAVTEYVIEWRGARVSDVKRALSAAVRRAGIPHVSSHVLKHTAITWMVQAGVSFERIAKFANTSKEMVERVYGHHSPSFVSEAIAAVAF
ncbi:site-specific integrase [Roseomonas genomospecies 6]|uniref:Site-specific integrase n=1 Tax=Roseomonas genomospecies 6 TaxID=214106 RepID=A0A9W7KMX2_9PROT|nr:site-specific integrase [Roseomonas genomospecies 6]KAA0675717.1 site-specific integrase [Roseomonas genomospecies 6]